jgi:hypothetical protein
MLQWINPWKWWRTFQIKRRWRRASLQFVHFYHRQDLATAESAAKSMVNILSGSGLRPLLLDSYYSLINSPDRFMMTESHTVEGFHSLDGI